MSLDLSLPVDLASVATFATDADSLARSLDGWYSDADRAYKTGTAEWEGSASAMFDRAAGGCAGWTCDVRNATRDLVTAVNEFHGSVKGVADRLDTLRDRAVKGGLWVSGNTVTLPPSPQFVTAPGTPLSPDAQAMLDAWRAKETLYNELATSAGEDFRSLEGVHRTFQQACGRIKAPKGLDVPGRPGGGGQGWSGTINTVQWWIDALSGKHYVGVDQLGARRSIGSNTDIKVDDPSAFKIGDIRQGTIGDCWLISALAATAQRDPGFLERQISYADGGWDVTLYQDGHPVRVHVGTDELSQAGASDANGNPSWISVYEAAVARHHGGNYSRLVADSPSAGLELVTGQPATQSVAPPPVQTLADAIADGRPVTAMTDPLHPWRDDLAAAHVYIVESVDPRTNEVTLVNPWGPGPYANSTKGDRITMSYADYQANFVMTGIGGRP